MKKRSKTSEGLRANQEGGKIPSSPSSSVHGADLNVHAEMLCFIYLCSLKSTTLSVNRKFNYKLKNNVYKSKLYAKFKLHVTFASPPL